MTDDIEKVKGTYAVSNILQQVNIAHSVPVRRYLWYSLELSGSGDRIHRKRRWLAHNIATRPFQASLPKSVLLVLGV